MQPPLSTNSTTSSSNQYPCLTRCYDTKKPQTSKKTSWKGGKKQLWILTFTICIIKYLKNIGTGKLKEKKPPLSIYSLLSERIRNVRLPLAKTQKELGGSLSLFFLKTHFINYILEYFGVRLPLRADSINYFLLGLATIICIFHLAVMDVAGGREETLLTLSLDNFWTGGEGKKGEIWIRWPSGFVHSGCHESVMINHSDQYRSISHRLSRGKVRE